jgi:hypothetical protein
MRSAHDDLTASFAKGVSIGMVDGGESIHHFGKPTYPKEHPSMIVSGPFVN